MFTVDQTLLDPNYNITPSENIPLDLLLTEVDKCSPYIKAQIFNPNDAADVLQDVRVMVWENSLEYDPKKGSIQGWVKSTARICVKRFLAKKQPILTDTPEEKIKNKKNFYEFFDTPKTTDFIEILENEKWSTCLQWYANSDTVAPPDKRTFYEAQKIIRAVAVTLQNFISRPNATCDCEYLPEKNLIIARTFWLCTCGKGVLKKENFSKTKQTKKINETKHLLKTVQKLRVLEIPK